MQTEIEAKFLNIDLEEMRSKLKELGAVCEQPMRLMRRKTFDLPGGEQLKQKKAWLRIRDEGDKVTFTYKQLNDRSINGTKEVEVNVSSFENIDALLAAVGMTQKSYQETKRETWRLGEAHIELDQWP